MDFRPLAAAELKGIAGRGCCRCAVPQNQSSISLPLVFLYSSTVYWQQVQTADFTKHGIAGWEYGNLTMEGEPESAAMRPYMYLRAGLQQGLVQQAKFGTNPHKFGLIGGTDAHNSLTSIEEDNYFGKHVIQEPRPERGQDWLSQILCKNEANIGHI